MDQLRFWTIGLLLWLAIFFHLDRFQEPIGLVPHLPVLAALLAIGTLSFRSFFQHPTCTILAASGLFMLLKGGLGYPLLGQKLPVTVTEVCSLALTVLMARQIAARLDDFQRLAQRALGVPTPMVSFDRSQHAFYREVRRARRFERPLAMLTIRTMTDAASPSLAMSKVQQQVKQRQLHARLAAVLIRHTKDSDLIAYDEERFALILPETREMSALRVAQRVRDVARQQLALAVSVGIATYPDQERTLDGLLVRAKPQALPTAHHLDKASPLPLSTATSAVVK